jgi:hypothetical protein
MNISAVGYNVSFVSKRNDEVCTFDREATVTVRHRGSQEVHEAASQKRLRRMARAFHQVVQDGQEVLSTFIRNSTFTSRMFFDTLFHLSFLQEQTFKVIKWSKIS